MALPADMRTSLSGEPLLDRLRLRETRATAELFERYAVEVNRLVWRLLGPDSEHNDIVQQVFVEAMAGIARARDEASLGAWLRGIAITTVRGELRRRKRRFFVPSAGHEQVERAAAPGSTKARRVYALLSRLAVDERQTFLLRYVEGNTPEQTATLLGCSLATVKRRLKHAEDKVGAWAASDPELGEMPRGLGVSVEQFANALAEEIGDGSRHGDLSRQKAGFVASVSQKPALPWLPIVVAASFACAALLIGFFVWRSEEATFEINGVVGHAGQEVTARADEIPIIFADGSIVRLLADSKLEIEKVAVGRVLVRLERGKLEAHVRHQTPVKWDFVTNGFDVRVVGTHLAIAVTSGVEVSVTEGAVRVSGQGLPAEGVEVREATRLFASAEGRYVVQPITEVPKTEQPRTEQPKTDR